MRATRTALLLTGMGMLAACASSSENGHAGLDARFGEATRANMAAQFVPPTPEQKSNTYIRPNPARQRLAIKAYEEGEVVLGQVDTE